MVPELADVQVERPATGTVVVVFSGEHDLTTRDEITGLFASLLPENELIVADVSDALFVDSSILGVLLDVNDAATELGRTFRVQLGTASIVRRAFELVGILDVIEVAKTRDAALAERR